MRKMKQTRNMIGAFMLAGCMLFTGCSGSDVLTELSGSPVSLTEKVEAAADTKAPDDTFICTATRFSIQLFKKEAEHAGENENYMISPFSAQLALAMAANGADGDTRTEMERLLCGDFYEEGDLVICTDSWLTLEDLNLYLNAYVQNLTDSENVSVQNANSMWIRNDEDRLQVDDTFLERIAGFDADCFLAPFDASTVKDINHWADTNTNGKIPALLNEISGDAVIYLLNAIAFEGKWQDAFEEYQLDDTFVFHKADGIEQTVTGMSCCENLYLENAHAKGFIKYYEGCRFGFAALLPEEGMTPEEYIAELTPESFAALFQERSNVPVNVKMPQFSSDYETGLNESLKLLGVNLAFTPQADFSGMAQTKTGELFISQVSQKTHIEVDEEGTKAAAVTSIEMSDTACAAPEPEPEKKVVILDRPFIYAIMDMDTGLPIFIGVVHTMK